MTYFALRLQNFRNDINKDIKFELFVGLNQKESIYYINVIHENVRLNITGIIVTAAILNLLLLSNIQGASSAEPILGISKYYSTT